MNLSIFLLVCVVAADHVSLDGALPQIETAESLTDVPIGALNGSPALVTEEDSTAVPETSILGRQNDITDEEILVIDEEPNESSNSSAPDWMSQGCTGENEYYNQCGPRCVQTCAFQPRVGIRNTRAVCESILSGTCHPGCFCNDGYVRFNNQCILPVNCPTRVCLGNEEFKRNGTPCQITCDSYKYAEDIENRCPKDIPISGCFCKHGYVRSATGSCILPNRCPRPLVS